MNKPLDYLEKYVEWAALALAALWVGYTGWAYWKNSPVTVAVGTTTLPPAQVDPWMVRPHGIIENLDNAINAPAIAPDPLPDFPLAFKGQMDLSDMSVIVFNNIAVPAPPPSAQIQPPTVNPLVVQLATLPDGPALDWIGYTVGPSVVLVPQGNAGAAAQPVMTAMDMDWVTVSWKLDCDDLAANFRDHKVFAGFDTQILQVDVYRQEETVPNVWGPEVKLAQLPLVRTVAPPPFPGPGSNPQAFANFMDWAAKHTEEIVEDPFYILAPPPNGKQWHPITRTAGANGSYNYVAPPPPPDGNRGQVQPGNNAPGGGAPGNKAWTPKAPLPGSPAKRPTGGPVSDVLFYNRPSGGGGGGGGGVQQPQQSRIQPLQNRRATSRPAKPKTQTQQVPTGPMVDPLGSSDAAAPVAPLAPPPKGAFRPAGQKDFEIWFNDAAPDTAPQPGHTYRYRIVVHIKNPLWNRPNAVADPAFANVFDIANKPQGDADWTDPITVPPLGYFYVADNGFNGLVQMEIYEWTKGQWTSRPAHLAPGDAIGNTGWTLVDLSPTDRQETRVVVANEHGEQSLRYLKTDEKDPVRNFIRQEVAKTRTVAGGGTSP